MKKLSLLIMLLTLALGTTQARTEKKSFDFSEAKKEWNEKSMTLSGSTITYNNGTDSGNAAVSWLGGTATDISGYDRLVLELEEASDNPVEVVVSNGGFWGKYASTTLATGNTSLSIDLKKLTLTTTPGENDTWKQGDAVDLTAVNMIYLRTGWCTSQTIKVKDFYLEKDIADYDQVVSRTYQDATLFPLTEDGVDKKIWGDNNTYDAATQTITFGSNYSSVGWTFGEAKDLSDYKTLVIELQKPIGNYVQLRFLSDDVVYSNEISQTSTTIRVDLTASAFNYSKDGTEYKNEVMPRTAVKQVYFWNSWDNATASIALKSVSLESSTRQQYYLLRENTTTKYGTICLPFAAAKPSNASIYKVKGIDHSDNATKLYLESVETMEAGVAYIYQSSDDQDVTFDKTGDATDHESPATATSGLVGTFELADAPVGNYILVSGQWKKVASGKGNKVGKYRASLSLSGLEVITEEQASEGKYTAMGVLDEGGVPTAIQGVEAGKADAACYTLGGVRVAKPTKGLCIKNGKKVLVK